MAGRSRVLDSWAVLAFLEGDEPAAGKVEEILADAAESRAALLMTTVNLGEVWYASARAKSEEFADARVSDILKLGVEVVSVGWSLARQAARYKVGGGIAYADCFALALARMRKAALVTGDPEFRPFERDVKIVWV